MLYVWIKLELVPEYTGSRRYSRRKSGLGRCKYRLTADIDVNSRFGIKTGRKNLKRSKILESAVDPCEISLNFHEMKDQYATDMRRVAQENETSGRTYKHAQTHHIVLKNGNIIGCTGDCSTKEDVLTVHPGASFKEVRGICPVCKQNYNYRE